MKSAFFLDIADMDLRFFASPRITLKPHACLILTPIYKLDTQITCHESSQCTNCPNFRHGGTRKLEVAMVNGVYLFA